MTWTYDIAALATTPLYQVRFLIGDTLTADQQLQDEEINFSLAQRPSIYGAGADCCRALASKLSRQADSVEGNQRIMYSSRAKAYALKAGEYETKAAVRAGALPYAGGISAADKLLEELNADRVTPQFNLGMTDNFLPVGPVGNEVPGNPENRGGGF